MSTTAIILAAGRGRRAGIGLPKTYREWQGKIVLRYSLETFLAHSDIDHVQVVIHPDDETLYHEAIAGFELPAPVYGGDTRAASVANALEVVKGDLVLIHDGARPFVSSSLITRVMKTLESFDGVIPALTVTDALWRAENSRLIAPVSRENLYRAQTPQGFHLNLYRELAKRYPDARDDAEAALLGGLSLGFVEGDANNVKLTFPEDFS